MSQSYLSEAKPCCGSGFCCHVAPCPFGKWDTEKKRCQYLVDITSPDEKEKRYGCGIYDDIIDKPGAEFAPAFGAGCCSPLFNTMRNAILRENAERHNDPYVTPAGFN